MKQFPGVNYAGSETLVGRVERKREARAVELYDIKIRLKCEFSRFGWTDLRINLLEDSI